MEKHKYDQVLRGSSEPQSQASPSPAQPALNAEQLMPTDSDDLRCLSDRADHYAKQSDEKQSITDYQDFIRFKLGEKELYGISYEFIEQILPAERLTEVPCTPDHIAGVINWCGLLLTVIDIGQLFNVPRHDMGDDTKIIVVSDGVITVGMMIDELQENDLFSPSHLEAPLTTGQISNVAFVKGIWLGRITILDITNLLSDKQIIIKKN